MRVTLSSFLLLAWLLVAPAALASDHQDSADFGVPTFKVEEGEGRIRIAIGAGKEDEAWIEFSLAGTFLGSDSSANEGTQALEEAEARTVAEIQATVSRYLEACRQEDFEKAAAQWLPGEATWRQRFAAPNRLRALGQLYRKTGEPRLLASLRSGDLLLAVVRHPDLSSEAGNRVYALRRQDGVSYLTYALESDPVLRLLRRPLERWAQGVSDDR